jgi:hypothetical protein
VNPGTDWAESARLLVETLRAALGGPAADDGTGSAAGTSPGECRWCPLCQLVAVLRGERPEVTAVVADVLRTTADALHAFAAAPEGPRPGPSPADERPAPPVGDPPPVVQRIEIA